MPIYEYQCQACDHEFEVLQKMSEDKLTDCPECNKPELKKLISAAAFRLKGSGWYESDFKKPSTPAKKTAEKNTTSCCSGGACSGG
ncbi:MAG: zinc ribbon domain-containing protein [Pseudomonadota bacterium]